MPLFHFDIWVQVCGLQAGCLSGQAVEKIGNEIILFLATDPNNRSCSKYMKVPVKWDVRRQFKKEIKLKKEGDWFWPSLQNEKLSSFCYLCGYLDHTEKFYRLLLQSPGEPPQRQFRPELRASNRRNTLNISARWLHEPNMEGGWQGSFGGDVSTSNGDPNSNFKGDKEGNGNGGVIIPMLEMNKRKG